MHQVELPQFLLERIERKRGHTRLFDSLVPSASALVVIDMQCAFVQEGAPLEVPKAREIVPNINRLANVMRDAGGTVVWIAMTMAADGAFAFPVYYRWFFQDEGRKKHQAALREGSKLHRLYPDLNVKDAEPVILKNRFSALIQGSSKLDAFCRERGIDTLIIVGTLTNVCCESTARDGMMLGYRVFMPADANATLSDEEHLASLMSVSQYFGDIRATEEVIALIRASGRGEQAAE